MDTVRDIMISRVVTSPANESAIETAKKMTKLSIGCVIVIEQQRPIGIVTERDFVKRLIAEGKDPKKTLVKDIMTSPIITIEPDVNIYYASRKMRDYRFKRFPVTENGKLIGVVTQSDFIKYFTEQKKKFVIEQAKSII